MTDWSCSEVAVFPGVSGRGRGALEADHVSTTGPAEHLPVQTDARLTLFGGAVVSAYTVTTGPVQQG